MTDNRSWLFELASVLVRAETALVAEFEASGEDPEKFAAFVNGAERKNRARA